MNLSNRRLVLAALLVLAVTTGIAGAHAFQILNGEPVSGDIPITASNGPQVTVTGASSLELTDFTNGPNTVEVTSDAGNATLSSQGPTNVTLDQIEGTWTNTSALDVASNTLTINPADKPLVEVSGDTETLDFRSMAVDDGQLDFVYSGSSGSTTITVTGLSTSAKVAAVDAGTNNVLDTATPSSGNATFALPNSEHAVVLQTSSGAPVLSDASPSGALSNPPQEVSVDVSDPDYPMDNVTVTAELDGNQIGTKTVDTAGEVSFSVNPGMLAGQHEVEFEATDAYGQTASTSTSFTTPNTLYIRNETSPSKLVNNSTTVSVTFFGDGDAIIERTTTNGTINMTGLPTDETFVVQAEADGYHPRTIIVENLWEQETIYLLSTTQDTVLVDFSLDDKTGQFIDDETSIRVQKSITINGSTEYRTIAGDYTSATGEVSVFLEQDERYRIVATSSTQTRRLGHYSASTAGEEVLPIGQVVLGGDTDQGYVFQARTINNSSQDYIRAVYVDDEQLTSSLALDVYYVASDGSETLVASRSVSQTLGTYSELIAINNSTNNYRIEWEAQRDGETITGNATVGELDDITDTWPISDWVLEMLAMVFVVGVGGLVVIYDSSLAALVMVAVAGLFTAVGVLAIPIWALAPAAVAALLFKIGDGVGVVGV
jgi:hypothetical protein